MIYDSAFTFEPSTLILMNIKNKTKNVEAGDVNEGEIAYALIPCQEGRRN